MAHTFKLFRGSYTKKKEHLGRGRLHALYELVLAYDEDAQSKPACIPRLLEQLEVIREKIRALEREGGELVKKWGTELSLAKAEAVELRSRLLTLAKKSGRDLEEVGKLRTKSLSVKKIKSKVLETVGELPVFVDLDEWEPGSTSGTSKEAEPISDDVRLQKVYVAGIDLLATGGLDREVKEVLRRPTTTTTTTTKPTTKSEPVYETVVSISLRDPIDALMKLRELHRDWFDTVGLTKLTGRPLERVGYEPYKGRIPLVVKESFDDPHVTQAVRKVLADSDLQAKLYARAKSARLGEEDDPLDRRAFMKSIETRWYPERRKVLDLAECGAGGYPEALRRLLGVKQALISGRTKEGDRYTVETLSSMGLSTSALVSISDATYCSIVQGWKPDNYLGPSMYGMPIGLLCTLLSLGNLYRGRESIKDRTERHVKLTMGTLGLVKSGVDTIRAFKTTKGLIATSHGIGIVGGTYQLVMSSKEFSSVKVIKDRFELVMEKNKLLVRLFNDLYKVRKNHPLLVFRDKILNGKLGRRQLRAVVGGLSGVIDLSSGIYGIVLLCGVAAIPAVGWSLAALGVLVALGTIGYSWARRYYREQQYQRLIKAQPTVYPSYIRTTGEYHRAYVSTYIHRGLLRPADDLHMEIATAMAWALFGGEVDTLQGAVIETDVVGMMELIKG